MAHHKIYWKACDGRKLHEGHVETLGQLRSLMRGRFGYVLRLVYPGFFRTQGSAAVYYERIY